MPNDLSQFIIDFPFKCDLILNWAGTNDVSKYTLALYRMRESNDSTFNYFRMLIDGVFNFCRPKTMATDINDVIDTTYDPVAPVFITSCSVTCEVFAGKR